MHDTVKNAIGLPCGPLLHRYYKFKIPDVWKEKLENKGKLFLSNQTLSETDEATLNAWCDQNLYRLNKVKEGAWITPVLE